MIRAAFSLFIVVFLFEVAFGAAYVSTEELRGILYRESMERQLLLPGASLRTVGYVESALHSASRDLVLPRRMANSSERMPGMLRPALPEEAAIERAVSGILAAPWVESMRLIGLLFLKRLAVLLTVLLFGALPIAALAVDGWHALQVRTHVLGAMRPSVFGSIGFLMAGGGLATLLILAYPADIPFGIWVLVPMLFGLSLRALIRSWHRF